MKTIAFFIRHFSERGTEVSTFDYAHFNETILGNQSVIISLHPDVLKQHNLLFLENVYQKFLKRFKIFHVQSFSEISALLEDYSIDLFYTQTHGAKELPPFDTPDFKIKSLVHCVFNTRFPQGTIYSAISDWVNESNGTEYPVVPYPIYLPDSNENLRNQLSIPSDAIVFGRYGGYTQFDVSFVRDAIIETARGNSNIYFLFMNTEPFGEGMPNIKFLPMQVDIAEKRKFINTCDAHIHARADGETFGLACGEFAICLKPLLTYQFTENIAHIKILKDKAIVYKNKADLIRLFTEFYPGKYNMAGNGYLDFLPEPVMKIFDQVFIQSENKKNYNLAALKFKSKAKGILNRLKRLAT
jgi:hypothetical protein